jgi:hypothetical protein
VTELVSHRGHEDHIPGAFVPGDLTRRQALTLGAAAGLAAMLGRAGTARAAAGDENPHLSRAYYVPLVGQSFAVAGSSLVLLAVSDLDHVRGRDDAFRLDFAGDPGVTGSGIERFGHAALGTFDLFVTPVCAVDDGVQHYEVVIDRSIRLPGDPAPAAATKASARTTTVRRKRRGKVRRVVARSKAKARAKRAAAMTRRAAAARRRPRRFARLRR